MEFFYSITLAVPVFQIVLLLMFSTIALLFGRIKLALLINYLFALYWGYFFNRDILFDYAGETSHVISAYFGFGLLIAIVAMIGFFVHHDT